MPVYQSFIGAQSSLGGFKVRVQFGQDWKVLQYEGECTITIKLKVIISNPSQSYSLHKNFGDFISLGSQLCREDRFGLDVYRLPEEFYRVSSTGQSEIAHKISLLKGYLNNLIARHEYYLPALMDFLQLNEAARQALFRE